MVKAFWLTIKDYMLYYRSLGSMPTYKKLPSPNLKEKHQLNMLNMQTTGWKSNPIILSPRVDFMHLHSILSTMVDQHYILIGQIVRIWHFLMINTEGNIVAIKLDIILTAQKSKRYGFSKGFKRTWQDFLKTEFKDLEIKTGNMCKRKTIFVVIGDLGIISKDVHTRAKPE